MWSTQQQLERLIVAATCNTNNKWAAPLVYILHLYRTQTELCVGFTVMFRTLFTSHNWRCMISLCLFSFCSLRFGVYWLYPLARIMKSWIRCRILWNLLCENGNCASALSCICPFVRPGRFGDCTFWWPKIWRLKFSFPGTCCARLQCSNTLS
jgi:hypothetical protein